MAFLDAIWTDLVLLNYTVPQRVVAPYLPAGCEIDWQADEEGQLHTYASLVLFEFRQTRAFGIAWPWHRNFSEINLRLYVIFQDPQTGERKRGVIFVRELVPRQAIASIARIAYAEPYVAMPIRRRVSTHAAEGSSQSNPSEPSLKGPGAGRRIEYIWGKGDAYRLAVHSADAWALPAAESHEEFILEHYWGYTRLAPNRTSEYRVTHPAWRASSAVVQEIEVDFGALYGAEWAFLRELRPASVFVAEGSPIEVLERRVVQL